jgi:hypothetical protein
MNTSFKNTCRLFFGVICAVTVLLMAANGWAQNLFISSDVANGYVTEIVPGVATNVYAKGFSFPADLAFDNKGDLFVLNTGSGNITEIKPGGTQIPFAAGLSSLSRGMVMDSSNNLFVADPGSARVDEFTPSGTQITVVTNVAAICVALDRAGNLYVGNFSDNNVLEFTNINGAYGTNYYVFASLSQPPITMVFNSVGDLFVDYYGNTGNGIAEITPGGMQNIFSEYGMSWPVAMVFDNTGNLYISDQSAGTINEYTSGGVESTYVSGLIEPAWLAFEPAATPPSLGIAPAGNQSVLFWPTGSGNFVLQSTTNLNSPNWATVSNGVPIIGFMVTNAAPGQFFRLQQQ